MDFKKTRRNSPKQSKRLSIDKERKFVKDLDSGLSSASSSDILDATDLQLEVSRLDGTYNHDNDKIDKTLVPVVYIERSNFIEQLAQQGKHDYLRALELAANFAHFEGKPADYKEITVSDKTRMVEKRMSNKTTIKRISERNYVKKNRVKYNLRTSRSSPTSIDRDPPQEILENADVTEEQTPGSSSAVGDITLKFLHTIKITTQASTGPQKRFLDLVPLSIDYSNSDTQPAKMVASDFFESEESGSKVCKKHRMKFRRLKELGLVIRRQTAKRKSCIAPRMPAEPPIKRWKRANDVPLDFRITSDNRIFSGSVIDSVKLTRYGSVSSLGSIKNANDISPHILSPSTHLSRALTPLPSSTQTNATPTDGLGPFWLGIGRNTSGAIVQNALPSTHLIEKKALLPSPTEASEVLGSSSLGMSKDVAQNTSISLRLTRKVTLIPSPTEFTGTRPDALGSGPGNNKDANDAVGTQKMAPFPTPAQKTATVIELLDVKSAKSDDDSLPLPMEASEVLGASSLGSSKDVTQNTSVSPRLTRKVTLIPSTTETTVTRPDALGSGPGNSRNANDAVGTEKMAQFPTPSQKTATVMEVLNVNGAKSDDESDLGSSKISPKQCGSSAVLIRNRWKTTKAQGAVAPKNIKITFSTLNSNSLKQIVSEQIDSNFTTPQHTPEKFPSATSSSIENPNHRPQTEPTNPIEPNVKFAPSSLARTSNFQDKQPRRKLITLSTFNSEACSLEENETTNSNKNSHELRSSTPETSLSAAFDRSRTPNIPVCVTPKKQESPKNIASERRRTASERSCSFVNDRSITPQRIRINYGHASDVEGELSTPRNVRLEQTSNNSTGTTSSTPDAYDLRSDLKCSPVRISRVNLSAKFNSHLYTFENSSDSSCTTLSTTRDNPKTDAMTVCNSQNQLQSALNGNNYGTTNSSNFCTKNTAPDAACKKYHCTAANTELTTCEDNNQCTAGVTDLGDALTTSHGSSHCTAGITILREALTTCNYNNQCARVTDLTETKTASTDNDQYTSGSNHLREMASNDNNRRPVAFTDLRQTLQTSSNNNVTNFRFDLREVLVNKTKCVFKAPPLPLSKRPPTRIPPAILPKAEFKKPTSTVPLKESNVLDQDFDDSISLFAESLSEFKTDDRWPHRSPEKDRSPEKTTVPDAFRWSNKCEPLPSSLNVEEPSHKNELPNVKTIPELPAIRYESPVRLAFENPIQVQEMPPENNTYMSSGEHSRSTPSMTVRSSPNLIYTGERAEFNSDTSRVDDWIASTVDANSRVHSYLRNLCKLWFGSNGRCRRNVCVFFHYVPNELKDLLFDLTYDQLQVVYKHAVNRPYLFTEMFHTFVDCFKENEDALVSVVRDIAEIPRFEKKPYVIQIISALQKLGNTFEGAVRKILLACDISQKWTFDVLLDIIVVEKSCLENNFSIVEEVMKHLKYSLDIGVVADIFKMCVNTVPPNEEFCKNIYKAFILKNIVSVVRIPRAEIVKYINLLYDLNLIDFAEHVRTTNGVELNEVKKPRNDVKEYNCHEARLRVVRNLGDNECGDGKEDELTFSNRSLNEEPHSDPDSPSSYSLSSSPTPETNPMKELYEENTIYSLTFGANETAAYVPTAAEPAVEEYVPTQLGSLKMSGTTYTCEDSVINSGNAVNRTCSYLGKSLGSNDSNDGMEYRPASCTSLGNLFSSNSRQQLQGSTTSFTAHHPGYTTVKSRTPSEEKAVEGTSSDNDDMTNDDIVSLTKALRFQNMTNILSLLQRYSHPNLSKSFVVHLLTGLKNLTSVESACTIIKNIFTDLENLFATAMPFNLTRILQLFGLNILFFLDEKKQYSLSCFVVNKFSNDLPGFVSNKCICQFKYFTTPCLRYMFIFKILMRGGMFKEALKLLRSPELKLFENLFVEERTSSHLEYSKRLINEFIEATLNANVPIAKDTIHFIILNLNCDEHIDIKRFLNQLLIQMLNQYNEFRIDLLGFFENILNGWYKYLQNGVLRALFIQLYNELPERKILEFYQICVGFEVYQQNEGNKDSIKIPSNLLKEEIYLSLHMYFYNVCKNNYPIKSIIISIEQQSAREDPEDSSIAILTNSRTSCIEMKSRIVNVLRKFQNPPLVEDSENLIVLPCESVRSVLTPYKLGNLPPLARFR